MHATAAATRALVWSVRRCHHMKHQLRRHQSRQHHAMPVVLP